MSIFVIFIFSSPKMRLSALSIAEKKTWVKRNYSSLGGQELNNAFAITVHKLAKCLYILSVMPSEKL